MKELLRFDNEWNILLCCVLGPDWRVWIPVVGPDRDANSNNNDVGVNVSHPGAIIIREIKVYCMCVHVQLILQYERNERNERKERKERNGSESASLKFNTHGLNISRFNCNQFAFFLLQSILNALQNYTTQVVSPLGQFTTRTPLHQIISKKLYYTVIGSNVLSHGHVRTWNVPEGKIKLLRQGYLCILGCAFGPRPQFYEVSYRRITSLALAGQDGFINSISDLLSKVRV